MKLKNLQNWGITELKQNRIEKPILETNIILCHILKVDRIFLATNKDYYIDQKKVEIFKEMIFKRVKGCPLQYILKEQEFMSLPFKVNSSVLIPRQDTETLIEFFIEYIKNKEDKNYIMLDIGTGSGCIAVSSAFYIKNLYVTAIDISNEALKVAKYNAKINKVSDRVEFLCKDIFRYTPSQQYDCLLSNPPYIPSKEILKLDKVVKDYEPLIALDGGMRGLDYYYRIVSLSESCLKKNGLLALETGINQYKEVSHIIEKTGAFHNINIIRDLAGIERVIWAEKK